MIDYRCPNCGCVLHVPGQEWIPVSERLPEKCGVYLVSGGNKVWLCEWVHIEVVHGWSNDVGNPMVIAWMPLPEPVKGRKEDGEGKEE